MRNSIGKKVEVIVDRPLGSRHPEYEDMLYPINYGYVPDIIAGDGEEQDAFIFGVKVPVKRFRGVVIAIIVRKNDNESKWVVASPNSRFTLDEIRSAVDFQEKYFETEIVT